MGNSLAKRAEGSSGSYGGCWSLVRADWRAEHCSPSMAICRPGGKKGQKREELGRRGVGGYSTQDCATDSEHAVANFDSDAMVTGRLRLELALNVKMMSCKA